MSQNTQLQSASSATTKAWSNSPRQGCDSSNVIAADYRWMGSARKTSKNTKPIAKLISELSINEEFKAGLSEGRKLLAEECGPTPSLRKLRLERNMSQTDLANATATHQPYIARVESGRIEPCRENIKKIAAALNVNSKDLWAILAGIED